MSFMPLPRSVRFAVAFSPFASTLMGSASSSFPVTAVCGIFATRSTFTVSCPPAASFNSWASSVTVAAMSLVTTSGMRPALLNAIDVAPHMPPAHVKELSCTASGVDCTWMTIFGVTSSVASALPFLPLPVPVTVKVFFPSLRSFFGTLKE